MGLFAVSCALSGAPINQGDKVRILLLTRNPFYQEGKPSSEPEGEWVPRTPGWPAVYNGYGWITAEPDSLLAQTVLAGFEVDLVHKGHGTSSRDEPCNRGILTWEYLPRVLFEGRVRVRGNVGKKAPPKRSGPRPTLAQVDRALKECGLREATTLFPGNRVIVRPTYTGRKDPGEVVQALRHNGWRVRYQPEEERVQVTPFQAARRAKKEKILTVACALVREDVWQASLLYNPSGEKARQRILRQIASRNSSREELFPEDRYKSGFLGFMPILTYESTPGVLQDLIQKGSLALEDARVPEVADYVVQTSAVVFFLYQTGLSWHPSRNWVAQEGRARPLARFLEKTVKVLRKR